MNEKVSPNVRIGGGTATVRDIRNGKSKIAMFTGIVAGMLVSRRVRLPRRRPTTAPVPKPKPKNCPYKGNPVLVSAGSKILVGPEDIDFNLPGLLGIEWARSYDSNDKRTSSLFGRGWSVPYEVELARVPHPQGGELWIYIDEEGNRLELGRLSLGDAFVSTLDGLAFFQLENGQTVVEDIYEGHYQVFETDPFNAQRSRLTRLGNRKRYRYDRFGRLCEKRIGSNWVQYFEYDAEHRLVCVEQYRSGERERVVFAYDPLGRRISKEVYQKEYSEPRRRVLFHWQGLRLLQEVQSGLPILYVYDGLNSYEPLARIDGTPSNEEVLYFQTNLGGLPEQLTNVKGYTVWCSEYVTWGKSRGEWQAPQHARKQNLRFQGQYLDRETGLHYNMFRFYDPDVGRFTQTDPIGLEGGLSTYAYAPNPLSWVDPLGLMECSLTGNEVGDATNLPIIKRGSPEWKKATETIQSGGKSNFRVKNRATADQLLKDARGKVDHHPTYSETPYKKGYEHHPNESHTVNAPENNIPHVKWKDWSMGKKSGGAGHIFYE